MGNIPDPKLANNNGINTNTSLKFKKVKINYPKLIFSLKDSIIIQVACGY
jgi:hypothetical protein